MDLAERRRADADLTRSRRAAREEFVRQSEVAAQADADYRRIKSITYLEARDQGLPSNGAEIVANAAAAEARTRRDIAASLARAAQMKIQEAERDAVTVRDLHAASERVDGLAP